MTERGQSASTNRSKFFSTYAGVRLQIKLTAGLLHKEAPGQLRPELLLLLWASVFPYPTPVLKAYPIPPWRFNQISTHSERVQKGFLKYLHPLIRHLV